MNRHLSFKLLEIRDLKIYYLKLDMFTSSIFFFSNTQGYTIKYHSCIQPPNLPVFRQNPLRIYDCFLNLWSSCIKPLVNNFYKYYLLCFF